MEQWKKFRKRMRLDKPLNVVLFTYPAVLIVLMIVMTLTSTPKNVEFWILGIGWALFLAAIGGTEIVFLLKEHRLRPFLADVFKTSIVMPIALSIFIAVLGYTQGLSLIWSAVLGLAVGVGIPINGALSGSLFHRLTIRGLM
jgi:hypothetical protein